MLVLLTVVGCNTSPVFLFTDCHACYHKTCFKGGKECPRCKRLAVRRERMARKNMEEQEDGEQEASGT